MSVFISLKKIDKELTMQNSQKFWMYKYVQNKCEKCLTL